MLTDQEIKCSLLWKMTRRHDWSGPVERDDLVREALRSTERGRGKEIVEELLDEPYITYRRHGKKEGYGLKNNPDAQAQAAYRLLTTCDFSELQIEASLSRFKDAGGFGAYDRDDMLNDHDEW